MRDLVILFIHFLATLARLLGPGGVRSVVVESLLIKHQLLIVNRSRQRAPNLSASDRVLAGWLALWVRPSRLLRSAIVLKASSLLGFHQAPARLGRLRFVTIKPTRGNSSPTWNSTFATTPRAVFHLGDQIEDLYFGRIKGE
jgi:hypothetical protein